MTHEDIRVPFERISVDPLRCGGVPCIRDLRIPVATVVAMVAEGMDEAQILADRPTPTSASCLRRAERRLPQ